MSVRNGTANEQQTPMTKKAHAPSWHRTATPPVSAGTGFVSRAAHRHFPTRPNLETTEVSASHTTILMDQCFFHRLKVENPYPKQKNQGPFKVLLLSTSSPTMVVSEGRLCHSTPSGGSGVTSAGVSIAVKQPLYAVQTTGRCDNCHCAMLSTHKNLMIFNAFDELYVWIHGWAIRNISVWQLVPYLSRRLAMI